MAEHRFSLRASFHYQGEKNKLHRLEAELLTDEGWIPLKLGVKSPGILLFVYSFFVCQHTSFHANSTERGLRLKRADETMELRAGGDWKLKRVKLVIDAVLREGSADQGSIAYIRRRMRQCPVSININEPPDYHIALNFK
ncbi:MAG: hypothetical protein OEN02_08700 [Gammaproteobacteria bacterium]|nr:hypothetical protein [Gammaproteobacteria bacterium]MDH3536549.1 hypothetical protein [Gammaproteobacteria bacterium]